MNILEHPNPLLLEKLRKVEENEYSEALEFGHEMIKTLKSTSGIGLAANQVGLHYRIIIMRIKKQNKVRIMINPELTEMSSSTVDSIENCLSIKKEDFKVKRRKAVTIKFINEGLREEELNLSGIDAICAQHEIDHLDGITIKEKSGSKKLNWLQVLFS